MIIEKTQVCKILVKDDSARVDFGEGEKYR